MPKCTVCSAAAAETKLHLAKPRWFTTLHYKGPDYDDSNGTERLRNKYLVLCRDKRIHRSCGSFGHIVQSLHLVREWLPVRLNVDKGKVVSENKMIYLALWAAVSIHKLTQLGTRD